MPASRTVTLGERSVTVRELTVAEVRDWMREVEANARRDVLHVLALVDCGLDEIARMSDASAESLEKYAPSDLAEVVVACKEVNSHFFRVRAIYEQIARSYQTHSTARRAVSFLSVIRAFFSIRGARS